MLLLPKTAPQHREGGGGEGKVSFWKKKEYEAEKERYVRELARTVPLNLNSLNAMTLDQLKELTEIGVAMRIYRCFEWRPDWYKPFRLDYDESTKSILISEEMLMYVIQLVNPDQPKRNIELIKNTHE
nr:MAG TPA: hypothetical protein [Caudoviricetes sp.]